MKKPRAEEEIEAATLDGEADPGEHRDDRRGEGDRRVEHEPELRQLEAVVAARVRHEERQAQAPSRPRSRISPQSQAWIGVSARRAARSLFRQNASCR